MRRLKQVGGLKALGILGEGGLPNGNTAVLFGDSIVLANSTHPTDKGFFNWFNALIGHKFNVIYNAGVGGDSTAQMLARIQADVIAKGARWCVVGGGVNDVNSDVPAATTIANLQNIYNTLHAARINVIGCTLPPSTSMNTEARGTAWTTINQAIRDFAAANSWLHLADVGPEYRDPAQPTVAVPLAGYTVDGTHPNSLGAGTLGLKMETDLAANTRLTEIINYAQLVTDANDPSIWINSIFSHPYNALMTGTGGAKTAPAVGTVANEWVVGQGGTWSKVARTDGQPGEWQQVVINAEAQATLTAYDTANAVPGDTLWAEAEIETDETWTNIEGIPLTLTFLTAAGAVISSVAALGWSSAGGSGTACVNPRTAVLRTVNAVVPETCGKLRIGLIVYGNVTGSATMRISRMCIRKVL